MPTVHVLQFLAVLGVELRIYNSHYGNGMPAMFTSQYYLKLRGKHCREPHCHNGVVDTLGHDFSHADKERTASNSQNDNYFHSKWSQVLVLSGTSCHFVNLLSFPSSSFFLSLKKTRDSTHKSRGHVEHQIYLTQGY